MNFIIIDLWLVYIDVITVILLYYDLSSRSWWFNMISRINESKTLPRHISYNSKCKFDDRKCNVNQKFELK